MFEKLNEELLDAKEKLQKYHELRRRLEKAQLELERERTQLSQVESELVQEGRDVQKLEGLSLTALFHTVLGRKDQQIHKERQEYLAAKLNYDECRESLPELQREVAALAAEIKQLGDAQSRYQKLLAQKERLIYEQGSTRAQTVLELTQDLANTRAAIKDVHETLEPGTAALHDLRSIISSLEQARDIGPDAEAEAMDSAKDKVNRAQRLLRRFQREVLEATGQMPTGYTIEFGAFSTFAEGLFGLLTLQRVGKSTIGRSLESLESVAQNLQHALSVIEQALTELHLRANKLEEETQAAIEGA